MIAMTRSMASTATPRPSTSSRRSIALLSSLAALLCSGTRPLAAQEGGGLLEPDAGLIFWQIVVVGGVLAAPLAGYVVKSLKDKLHREHLVSVAEVAALDHHRLAVMGVSVVSNSTVYAGAVLDRVVAKIQRLHDVRLEVVHREILTGDALYGADEALWTDNERREVFDEIAPTLSRDGFKILLDIIVSATRFRSRADRQLRIGEVAYEFRARHAGESKMNPLIVIQFLGLLLSKFSRGLLPTSFLLFGMVGGSGVLVHLLTLWLTHEHMAFNFTNAQLTATLVAMTTNFVLNNELTYADKKLRGRRFWTGLLSFYAICSIGALANVSFATWIYAASPDLFLAGMAGAVMSVVFNYSVSRTFTWR